MARYLLQRLGMTLAVIGLVMLFLAAIVHLIPGDPVSLILGARASDVLAERVRDEMGLNQPVLVQLWNFFLGVLQGDLGRDFVTRLPVTTLIANTLPHTIILALTSLGMAALVGIPLGVYSATRPGSWMDRVTGLISVSFITTPSYMAGLLSLLVFAVLLGVLPATGTGDLGDPLDYLRHLILPSFALAITWVGYLARLVRTSMLEVANANYIRVARAYGLKERQIYYRYGLKNALVPTVAILGVALGNLMGGAVFIEVIFARNGLGTLIFDAIADRNFPVVRGGVLVIAVLFVVANLIADLSYRWLDPRMRVEEAAA